MIKIPVAGLQRVVRAGFQAANKAWTVVKSDPKIATAVAGAVATAAGYGVRSITSDNAAGLASSMLESLNTGSDAIRAFNGLSAMLGALPDDSRKAALDELKTTLSPDEYATFETSIEAVRGQIAHTGDGRGGNSDSIEVYERIQARVRKIRRVMARLNMFDVADLIALREVIHMDYDDFAQASVIADRESR